MTGQQHRKAINFDLDTATLRNLFGERGRRKAYTDIGRFLKIRGFEHRQGSGYRSDTVLTTAEVIDLAVALYQTLPWLIRSVQELDVTNIGREYNMNEIAKRRIKDEDAAKEEFDVDKI